MRLIDANEVKKRYPIMENDFGMVINDRLHKELDKIPTVEALPKADYETRLKADMMDILDKIRAEVIEKAKCTMNDTRAEGLYMAMQIIDKYRGE